jgi:hypothetical protein
MSADRSITERGSCSIIAPGHTTNLTGVKIGLAGRGDARSAPVRATVTAVEGERIILALAEGALEARCHDAQRLAALLDTVGTPSDALLSVHDHQLFVEFDPEAPGPGGGQGARFGTQYISPSSGTGVFLAFNLALPWHASVPCTRAERGVSR